MFGLMNFMLEPWQKCWIRVVLQIRRGNVDNLGKISRISQLKHILLPII